MRRSEVIVGFDTLDLIDIFVTIYYSINFQPLNQFFFFFYLFSTLLSLYFFTFTLMLMYCIAHA